MKTTNGVLNYRRMPIEEESPEEVGYGKIKCNLTESSMPDGFFNTHIFINNTSGPTQEQLFQNLALSYTDHMGNPKLRELIAGQHESLNRDDVLITVGAAHALFMIATSLLDKTDGLIVAHPNYSTNLETPEFAIGCQVHKLKLSFESNWQINPEDVETILKNNNNIKLVSVTTPHNPSGVVTSTEVLQQIYDIVVKYSGIYDRKIYLLVDETYRDMFVDSNVDDKISTTCPPVSASFGSHAISVSSLSKSYGLPGLRIGWAISTDKYLMGKLLAAKEQIIICGSVIDEELGYLAFSHRDLLLKQAASHIASRREIVKQWINEHSDLVEWVEPKAGVVCFPRIKAEQNGIDIEKFHSILNEKYGTFVGPGSWFGLSRVYLRIGFGWPTDSQELRDGLANIILAIGEAKN